MAAFASYAAAETRCRTKVADGTWIMAHICRTTTGASAIAVNVMRKMAPTSVAARQNGAWVEITDDTVV